MRVEFMSVSHANSPVATPRPRPAGSPARADGPVWAGIAIAAVALAVGMLFAVLYGGFNWVFTACFAVGALVAVAVCNLRGLFITVASLPLLFAAFTALGGWWLAGAAPQGSGAFSSASLITAGYPLIERFPSLLITTLAAALLAVLRLWIAGNRAKTQQARETATRRATATANRRNRESVSRARARTGTVSVADLKKRYDSERAARPARPRGTSSRAGWERDREERRREQAARRAAPRRPDPNRRAGDTPYPGQRATWAAQPAQPAQPEQPAPRPETPQRRRATGRLDEDLYGSD